MTPHESVFVSYRPDSTRITLADGQHLQAIGIGTAYLQPTSGASSLFLHDVLLCPSLRFSLISVFKLGEDHLHVEFTRERRAVVSCPFDRALHLEALWSEKDQAYLLPGVGATQASVFSALSCIEEEWRGEPFEDEAAANEISALPCAQDEERDGTPVETGLALPSPGSAADIRRSALWRLWHDRLAHLPHSALQTLAKNCVGLPAQLSDKQHVPSSCWVCSFTNIRRPSFPHSTTRTTRALELVHADLTGRIVTPSLGGAQYLAVLVDDYTRMVWVLPLARKSDFTSAFVKWRDQVVPYKGSITCLRTDGGGEFASMELGHALAGARHEKSCAYTAQQNGVAERHVGIIKNLMRALIHQRQLPIRYWAEAACAAAYIRNRRPSAPIGGKTPHELWHGSPPDVSNLRVFGCLAFAMLPTHARDHSLAPRSQPGVFVGYDDVQKGYRIHVPATNKMLITPKVIFHEDTAYAFSDSASGSDGRAVPVPDGIVPGVPAYRPAPSAPGPMTVSLDLDDGPALVGADSARGSVGASSRQHQTNQPGPAAQPPTPAPALAPGPAPAPVPAPASAPAPALAPAHGSTAEPADRARPQRPEPYHTRSYTRQQREAQQLPSAAAGVVISLADSFATAYRAQLSTDGVELEPDTLRDAMRRPDWSRWLEAMQEEINSHETMGTWVLEELPEDANLVGCRWVFKLKLDADGNVQKYKARLVAQGYSQIPGIDFDQTYAPVLGFAQLRALLTLAMRLSWHVHTVDVVTAYLNGYLTIKIYMKQPPHFVVKGREHWVCRLLRALYGLRQSGRAWYFTLRLALIEFGFVPCLSVPSIFVRSSGDTSIIVAVYVDDIIVMGPSLAAVVAFKAQLAQKFKMTDQGEIGHFLGMSLKRDQAGAFTISQTTYIIAMLERFDLTQLRPVSTPLECKQRLAPFDGVASPADCTKYQAMIGCLNWLAQASRPDIAFAVSALARYNKNPGPQHFGCAKRVMRYLAGTSTLRLRLDVSSDQPIVAFSDADFGGDSTAKSTSGWSVQLYGATVVWGSRLQPVVADSTAQAEVVAVWQTAREVAALRNLLVDLGFFTDDDLPASLIYCDNKPAIHIITNPVAPNGLVRHIERKYLSTRDQVERKLIDVTYVDSASNHADLLTKALPPGPFTTHSSALGLSVPASPST